MCNGRKLDGIGPTARAEYLSLANKLNSDEFIIVDNQN